MAGLQEANCFLSAFIADNLKRAILRESLNHASNFACEYCISKAVQYCENYPKAKDNDENDLQIRHFQQQIEFLESSPSTSSANVEQQIKILRSLIEELKKKKKKSKKKVSHSLAREDQ